MKVLFIIPVLLFSLIMLSQEANYPTFKEHLLLVQKSEPDCIVLKEGNSKILISPNFGARILTSTANKKSYAWLNEIALKENIQSKNKKSYGAEDRLWFNPLGSKFTLYYNQKEIIGSNWNVPKLFDTATFKLVDRTLTVATFQKKALITNNIGTKFTVHIDRHLQLFSKITIENQLQITIPKNVFSVGFSSNNSVTNTGKDWQQENGLIAPWILGMFRGSKRSTAIFPFNASTEKPLQLKKYLGEFGTERVSVRDSVIYFKTDGDKRSKIGLMAKNSTAVIGNYDATNKILTIITFTFHPNGKYLSSTETNSEKLFKGDVVNCYNNNPINNSSSFFELETTAPAKELKTRECINHIHNTYHFEGSPEDLNRISKKVLGVDLSQLRD